MRTLALVTLAIAASVATAEAYPYFQLTTGSTRCSQCHISPTGGGLLTPWGRSEAGDTISSGGDGAFLHGAIKLPDSLALGGDVRVAALANDVGASDGTELAAFPMQAELGAAYTSGPLTFYALVGARGRVRSGTPSSMTSDASTVTEPTLASYVTSREHYVMYRPDVESGIYVRAGRFAAPYGLRLADHTAYVRRYLGFNLLEETYGVGVGWLGETLEIHATGFVSDPLQFGPRKEAGGALLVEGQGTRLVLGGSARAGVGELSTRLQAGTHAKLLITQSTIVQAEIDGVRELFDGPGDRWQLAAYAGPAMLIARGVHAGVAYQAFAEDLHVQSVVRQGLDAWLAYLPIAHVEIMASARAQRIGPHEHAYNAMLQLHYYL